MRQRTSDAPQTRRSIRSRRLLPAYDESPRPLKDDSFDWLPNAIFRRNKPVQSRYGSDDRALN
jgi:hypothetical protein